MLIREFNNLFDGRDSNPTGNPEDYVSTYSIRLFKITDNGQVALWTTNKMIISRCTDLAILKIIPLNETARNYGKRYNIFSLAVKLA